MAALRIFGAAYEWRAYGGSETAHFVVAANSESEALGVALSCIANSRASDWNLIEIDPAETGAWYLDSYNCDVTEIAK